MEVTERSVAAVGTVLCLTFDISKKSIILRWKSHAPPLLSVLCVCVRWCHSLARPHLSSTSCCFILALWKYVPVAAVISRWVGNVDFSVCVLPNWPFLWQSISVKAVRTSRVIQTERNKNHSWALSRQQASRREHSHIVWLTGPSTAWMRETSVTRYHCELEWGGFPISEILRDESPRGPRRLLSWT